MTRRPLRRAAAVLVAAALGAAIAGATLGGPASAQVGRRVPAQTPPPPGSGVVIVVQEPQILGPRSFT